MEVQVPKWFKGLQLVKYILCFSVSQIIIIPVIPVDGAVAVPPRPGSIQSRAHPFNVETACTVVARHMFAGVRKEQDDGACLPVSLDEDLDFQ